MSGLGLFRLHPGFRRGSSSSDEDSPPRPPPNPHRVKRALFGPTDHEENLRFVRNEMKKAKNEAASKWNFDFDKGTPLKGRFTWEEANPAEVHAVYNLERLPYLSTHSESETKENRVSKSQDSSPVQDPLAEPAGSIDDLRTPQQGPSQPPISPSSPETTEQPPPSELGARPKDKNAKEKKLTDLFRSRKSRSKSSSKLRLKRLEGGISSRSPSVKSRVTSDRVPQPGDLESDLVPYPLTVGSKITQKKTEDTSSSD